ncbi:MAG TPA: geranylgeranyl reductase family protein [Saprospiraceae bacterium]|nr:geranylgeranyl reductase family protein [Lewinellaceae bacterium]HQU59043.1 geranylgeranyl reductase family protein [Saprospiraceae bacterium]
MIRTDACIVGAGPGGVATALRLSYLGIPCVLIDRSAFPRDKVCGDAISGKVTTLLNRLDPAILQRFNGKAIQSDVWGIKFVAPNRKELAIPFKPNYVRDAKSAPGYVSRRLDFDHFLIEEVRRRDNIHLVLETDIQQYERTASGWLVSDKDGQFQVETKMLIVADGAFSAFSRKIAGLEKDPKHHASAVRAYFSNVGQLDQDNFIELHFIQSITPGYFWIFPLPNGMANVGLGMRSDILNRRKLNLRKALSELIEQHPALRERFQNATLAGPVKGYGLPLGSKSRPLSGGHYMLVGDAGHLVDPLTGEGIGNAFYSGFIAAEQLEQCLARNDFSASFLKAYDRRVSRVLGSEMRLSYRLQKMLMYPFLVNALANLISSNRRVLEVLSGMYNDFALREQLARPVFWIKMLFKR